MGSTSNFGLHPNVVRNAGGDAAALRRGCSAPHLSAPRLPCAGPAGEPGPTRSRKVCLIAFQGFGRMGNQAYSPHPPKSHQALEKHFLRNKKKVITELALKNERVFSRGSKSYRNHRKIQENEISGAHIPESAQSRSGRSCPGRPRRAWGWGRGGGRGRGAGSSPGRQSELAVN